MTIYERPRSEVFASNAPESEVSDFTAWLRGLGIAFDETNGLPEMSGLNNVFNLLNQYIKYLEQNGFAEWSNDLEYPVGAGVRIGAVWYRAKTQNTNKTPSTSQNDWEVFLNASALKYENPIYIENNIVKVRSATRDQVGVVQFANDLELVQRAGVDKAVNPSGVATMFSSSMLENGWVKLPNNLILQWGIVGCPANYSARQNVTFNFPLPFPNTALVIVGSNHGISQATPTETTSISKAQGRVFWGASSPTAFGLAMSYIAIGY